MKSILVLSVLAILGGVLVSVAGWLLIEQTSLGPAPSDYGLVLHALGGKFLTLTAAVVFFWLIDSIFLPFLRIDEAFFNEEQWRNLPVEVRSAVVRGWFLVFASIILGFAWGGAT